MSLESLKSRIGILGTGLIGGSIWLRLHELGFDVVGWDPDENARYLARQIGMTSADSIKAATEDRDLVFLAGPISTLSENLRIAVKYRSDKSTITDVGSTKSGIVSYASEIGCSGIFIGGHPMAGTETTGLQSANPGLFDGAAWVLTLTPDTKITRFRELAAFITTTFNARVVPLLAEDHDGAVALSSHIPHILAGGLAYSAQISTLRDTVLGLAAGSFRDGTRVASTLPERTADMLWNNRKHIRPQLKALQEVFREFDEALEQPDEKALKAKFSTARELRDDLLAPHVGQFTKTFGVDNSPEEYQFLIQLGRSGSYISECQPIGQGFSYKGSIACE